jgi:hypothetical protein
MYTADRSRTIGMTSSVTATMSSPKVVLMILRCRMVSPGYASFSKLVPESRLPLAQSRSLPLFSQAFRNRTTSMSTSVTHSISITSDAIPSIRATTVPSVPRPLHTTAVYPKRLLLKEKLSGLLFHGEWPIKDEGDNISAAAGISAFMRVTRLRPPEFLSIFKVIS